MLDLRSTPLAGRPLAEALLALARAFTSETGVRVHIQAAGLPELPLRTEAELYRIVQEALTNVRKHADATQVTIVLRAGGGYLSLLVRDDGAGFAPESAGNGHGILGMRERARLLGGRLRLRSQPGQGTTVSLRLALEAGAP